MLADMKYLAPQCASLIRTSFDVTGGLLVVPLCTHTKMYDQTVDLSYCTPSNLILKAANHQPVKVGSALKCLRISKQDVREARNVAVLH